MQHMVNVGYIIALLSTGNADAVILVSDRHGTPAIPLSRQAVNGRWSPAERRFVTEAQAEAPTDSVRAICLTV